MTFKPPKYPLEQVLAVKKDRVEKAQKIVDEKKKALEIEEEKLKKVVDERDLVLTHHDAKLAQLRQALDEGTTSEEVLRMKSYLKVVKEKLIKEEARVKTQKEAVHTAERNLEAAKKDLHQKRIDEEKIHLHKEEWTKEMKQEIEKKETGEHDEIGQVLYESHKRKKKSS